MGIEVDLVGVDADVEGGPVGREPRLDTHREHGDRDAGVERPHGVADVVIREQAGGEVGDATEQLAATFVQ